MSQLSRSLLAIFATFALAISAGCVTIRSKDKGGEKVSAVITPGGPIVDAAATAVMNPGYRNQYKVEGTCDIISPDGMSSPCLGITLVLQDSEGKELSRARVTEVGRFAFAVQREQKYRVVLDSEKLKFSPETNSIARDARPNQPIHLVLVAR